MTSPETIYNAFPEGYAPAEAIIKLFSHPFQVEDLYQRDFLLALTERQRQYNERSRLFLKGLEQGSAPVDPTLQDVVERVFEVERCPSFPEYHTMAGRDAFHFLNSHCSGVGPTSLYALWAFYQTTSISADEESHLLETLRNWPVVEKGHPLGVLIATKFRDAFPNLCQKVRAPKMGEFEKGNLPIRVEGELQPTMVLSDIDHRLYNWSDTFK